MTPLTIATIFRDLRIAEQVRHFILLHKSHGLFRFGGETYKGMICPICREGYVIEVKVKN